MNIKNRIKEYKLIPKEKIQDNPKNWRIHPENQKMYLKEVLEEVGFVNAVLVREIQNDLYELIDGHLRKDLLDDEIPCLVLDVNEEEANILLTTVDPITELHGTHNDNLKELIESIEIENDSINDFLESIIQTDKKVEQVINNPSDHWVDMPDYESENLFGKYYCIKVHIKTKEDLEEFSNLLDQKLSEKTKSIWFPKESNNENDES